MANFMVYYSSNISTSPVNNVYTLLYNCYTFCW